MKETLAELERWGADVIFGRAKGFRASMMRVAMSALSGVYRVLVQTRLLVFRKRWIQQHHLGTLVISIGNLSVGGTGKTPVVELLSRTLRDRGRRVAILSRGYKSRRLKQPQTWKDKDGSKFPAEQMPKLVSTGRALMLDSKFAGDEPFMLARNLDGVAVVVDKDRVKGGRFAVGQLGADTLLLDDGLQYLHLSHAIDIVLIDRSSPFGTGALLPRGTLREPPRNLCRASYILITKCDGSPNDALIAELRRHNRVAPIIECAHGPRYLEELFTGERQPLEFLKGKWTAAISGIAVPEGFERGLEKLGARVEIRRRFSDHHRFSRHEIDKFMARCIERDMELVVTTEKDAVRFPRPKEQAVPIYFLRIEVEILKGHDAWDDLITRLCHPSAPGDPILRHRHAYSG
ncbi:MAG: tetraacyldisaccharide 4'-kinase [Verrucomicrobia bacterium]|nr:MAG: tetraacyldisaccharide 4'-kinase [Verrucomicrobiota bacterium]TAE88058.1 MAG: tetraacyldisaccharide 4'-kinase [Verrucomicrobiota bacterium]TAF26271.1 MAG: tetraacyldisaccharide 4'-kinase [Verrucomicrobiota bacterium]TAF41838.1 MAG: tetraacyldisaccharide 4'-kinase [Verrucomicrobiota bacterium]